MSRFQKLAHVIWHCQFHIVFVPKYRYRVLTGDLGRFVYGRIITHTERLKCQVVELKVQADHVHLLVMVPPKISISQLVGTVKGKVALQVFEKFPDLRTRRYWGKRYDQKLCLTSA